MAVKPVAHIVNLERGNPSTAVAEKRLKMELATLKRLGVKCIKIIHGYGSGGTGGAIRQMCRSHLKGMLRTRSIRAFCIGEQFGPFEAEGREVLQLMPRLRTDRDWSRSNPGITIVVI
jgi:hypothetical protein